MSYRNCFVPFSWFSPQPQMFPSNVRADQYSAQNLRRHFRSPECALLLLLPLCAALFSQVVCPVNSGYLELAGIKQGSSFLMAWKLSSSKPGSNKALVSLCSGLTLLHCLFLNAWKTFFIHFYCCCLRWGKTDPYYSIIVKMFHLGFWLELMEKLTSHYWIFPFRNMAH